MTEAVSAPSIEVGPGNVLAQMVRWVNRTARVITAEEILQKGFPNAETEGINSKSKFQIPNNFQIPISKCPFVLNLGSRALELVWDLGLKFGA
jgi:hypothetical protein